MINHTLIKGIFLVLLTLCSPVGLETASTFARAAEFPSTPLRALHMQGNWGGNENGIKISVTSLLDAAPTISANSIDIYVFRSGDTVLFDRAQVLLTGVTLGSGETLSQASFWIKHDVGTNHFAIEIHPSLDPSLSEVTGFLGDVSFCFDTGIGLVDTSSIFFATGLAYKYVTAVAAHALELMQSGVFTVAPPATFDKPAIMETLKTFLTYVQQSKDKYFLFLRSNHVEWIGISVAMFIDNISDPTVRLRYRPQGDESCNVFTFEDDDLFAFIARAKQWGFKIYLTLAFEEINCNPEPPSSDPFCNTAQYQHVKRFYYGNPYIDSGDIDQICLNPEYWWWNPSHPDHTANVASFWSSYAQIAVKYAELAQQLGVDMFSIGTETPRLFRTRADGSQFPNHFKEELTQLLNDVRAVYSGLVTYDQWSGVWQSGWFGTAAGQKFLFQDIGLDAVGVSAYFQLTDSEPTRVLSLEELETNWERVFQEYLIPMQVLNTGKPIVFLEFGYVDSVGSPFNANSELGQVFVFQDSDANGIDDGREQQSNIFQAFFNVNEKHNRLVRGAFVWGNDIFSDLWSWLDLHEHRSFGIYQKPSEQVIRSVYGGWPKSGRMPFSSIYQLLLD